MTDQHETLSCPNCGKETYANVYSCNKCGQVINPKVKDFKTNESIKETKNESIKETKKADSDLVSVELNPEWKLPLNKKQHLYLFIGFSIIYSLLQIDTYLEQYSDALEVVVFVFLFSIIEVIIYFYFRFRFRFRFFNKTINNKRK